jgi:hypothetical protein
MFHLISKKSAPLFFKIILVLGASMAIYMTLANMCVIGGWNGYRLAQAFAVRYGFGLYDGLDAGPIMDNVYGPTSSLILLPVAFIPFGPEAVSIVANFINWSIVMSPLALLIWMSRKQCDQFFLAAVAIFALLLLYSHQTCTLICFSLGAQTAAVGLGLLACIIVGMYPPPAIGGAVIAGVLTAFGVWSKQHIIFLVPGIALVLWLSCQRRAALAYLGAALVSAVVLTAVFALLFDGRKMWINMFELVFKYDWNKGVWPSTIVATESAIGVAERMKVLGVIVFRLIGRDWPLFASAGVFYYWKCGSAKKLWDAAPVVRAGAFLYVAALALFVPACLGRVKFGTVEHEGFMEFPLFLSLIAIIVSYGNQLERRVKADHAPQSPLIYIGLGTGIVCLICTLFPFAITSRGKFHSLIDNDERVVYNYSLKHPAAVAFPWNPLGVLLAEKRLTTFENGVLDKNAVGMTVSPQRLKDSLPNEGETIAYPKWNLQVGYIVGTYQGWQRDDKGDQELPGFVIYRRVPDVPIRFK